MRSPRPLLAAAAFAAAALSHVPALAEGLELPVREKTLGNGLKVLVLEDRTIPNCALYVWWRVGSRDERLGATGIAHFFEHMMFRGGARYGKTFDVEMEAAGGSNNAFTTRDVTVYQDWFPKEALPLVLDMEADRMGGMAFDPEAVKAEREVVASEWRLDNEQPSQLMRVQLYAHAYTEHPYRWDVLGWWNDVESWKQSDLEEFFTRNYAPNNATLVLVGDVDAPGAFRLIEERLGKIPRRPEREPPHGREPEQQGERRIVLESAVAQVPQLVMAWHVPQTRHPDFAVLEVLEAVLFYGESSRLVRLLVEEEQLCQGVGGGWQDHQFDPSLFTVDLVMRDGVSAAAAEALVDEEVAKLCRDGPSERELEKARNTLRANLLRRLKTIDGKASVIGETETFFGGWRELPSRLARIEKVTAQDCRRVASAYFTRRNRTVVALELAGEGAPHEGEAHPGGADPGMQPDPHGEER